MKFTILKKRVDFLRISLVTGYELNVTGVNLASRFQWRDIHLALAFGATVFEGGHPQQPTKAGQS